MNNKKIILATVGGVVVLALLIIAIVLAVKSLGGKTPDVDGSSLSSSSSSSSSSAVGTSSASGASSDQSDPSQATVSGGTVKLPSVKATVGETVSVPITLSKNPGVNAARLVFEYDADALIYDGCENGDIFDDCLDNDSDGSVSVLIQSSGIEDITDNGTLLTLSFTVKDSAAKGTYSIHVSEDSMFCNADEQIVTPDISDGTVTVN